MLRIKDHWFLAVLLLISSCASLGSSGFTREYGANYDGTIEAVERAFREVGMEIESVSETGPSSTLIVGRRINMAARYGAPVSDPHLQPLNVLVERLEVGTRVRVTSPAEEASYASSSGPQFRTRFLKILDRELGR